MLKAMNVHKLVVACTILVAAGDSGASPSPLLKNFTGLAPPAGEFQSNRANHPGRCRYLGIWNDSIGGTYVEKSKLVGTYTNPSCSLPFTVVVTSFTKAGVTVDATNTGSDECIPSFEVTGTMSDCTNFSGNFNNGYGNFPYSATKAAAARTVPPNSQAPLAGGLR
jgi:hypothetical protein